MKLPDKFQLGFDEFTTAMPKTAVAPLLGQELSQIQMLINILLDAKVDSVTSFHRAPLPEEGAASRTPVPKPTPAPARKGSPTRGQKSAKPAEPSATPSTANLVERNVVDLTFKAAPAAARKVLNEIASSTGQFFIIRTLYVHNEKDKGPPREKTGEANPSRDRNGIEFHRRQRAHRSHRQDRDAKVYFLTTNADSPNLTTDFTDNTDGRMIHEELSGGDYRCADVNGSAAVARLFVLLWFHVELIETR